MFIVDVLPSQIKSWIFVASQNTYTCTIHVSLMFVITFYHLNTCLLEPLRDLELRWVELLANGSQGLGTPYFGTYFEDSYQFKLVVTPGESNSDQVKCAVHCVVQGQVDHCESGFITAVRFGSATADMNVYDKSK